MSNYFRVPTTALFLLATLTATSLAGTATTASDLPATSASVPPTGNWRIISGLNIQGDYSLSGHTYDGVLLVNSNITGSLRIDDVDHLYLLGNTIGSIWMPGLYATTNVTILPCSRRLGDAAENSSCGWPMSSPHSPAR